MKKGFAAGLSGLDQMMTVLLQPSGQRLILFQDQRTRREVVFFGLSHPGQQLLGVRNEPVAMRGQVFGLDAESVEGRLQDIDTVPSLIDR